VRHRRTCHVYAWCERLLELRNAGRLRNAPKLHGGRDCMHVQRGSHLPRRRKHLRKLDNAGRVLEGRARLLLSGIGNDLYQRCVQRRHVLHQRMRQWRKPMYVGHQRQDLRHWEQRLPSMERRGVQRGHAVLLPGELHRHPTELPGRGRGHDELRSEQRELLREPGSDGRNIQ
jgi:hypothetical protein